VSGVSVVSTPADEYEQAQAERREKAVAAVARYLKWWFGGQVATAVLWFGATTIASSLSAARPNGDTIYWATLFPLAVAAAIAGFFTFEVSVVVAVVGLRHSSVLPRRWMAGAGAVWLITVTELVCLYFMS
jgi:hypothetical protein